MVIWPNSFNDTKFIVFFCSLISDYNSECFLDNIGSALFSIITPQGVSELYFNSNLASYPQYLMDILLSLYRRTPAPDHYRFLANGLGAELYNCRNDYKDHRKRPGKWNISEAIATREYSRCDRFLSFFLVCVRRLQLVNTCAIVSWCFMRLQLVNAKRLQSRVQALASARKGTTRSQPAFKFR